MPGDWMLDLDWPTCGIDNQKCPSYLSRCDQCDDRERRMLNIKRWVIITNNREKAKAILQTIAATCDKGTIAREIYNKSDMFIEMSDGTLIRWWHYSESVKGMKCNKLWCDKEIDKTFFENAIKPNYFGKQENIIWI